MPAHPQHYMFDGFTIDAVQRVLLRGGYRVQVTPKALDILLALVQRSGEVVDKETLMKEVWPDTFVEDINLAYNIHVLRKVLGAQTGSRGEYIETIPKRGYRFVQTVREAPLEEVRSEVGREGTSPAKSRGQPASRQFFSAPQKSHFFVAVLLLTVATVLIVFGYSNKSKQPETDPVASAAVSYGTGAPSDLQSRAKRILGLLIDERFSEIANEFDPNLRKTLTPKQVKQVWNEVKRDARSFKRILDVTSAKGQGFDVVDVRCEFEAGRIVLRVAFNAQEEIGGLWLLPANSTSPEAGASDGAASDELRRLARDIVNKIVQQDFNGVSKGFDSSLRSTLTLEQMQREWRQIVAQAGSFQRIVDIQRDYDVVDVRLQFRRGIVNVRIGFDAQKNINALYVRLV